MAKEIDYRSDIDGLRGVAILLVLLFHGFSRFLPGGFVGVDVFFVISGYLITSLLLKDIHQGRFSIARFYSRRIRRIFPALITVLAAACALGWLLQFPNEFTKLGKAVAGGAGFIANLQLCNEVSGYFAEGAESKPLLHLWSLGIEEQFYIFFPVLLLVVSRKNSPAPRLLMIGILLALSFELCLYGTRVDTQFTFYLPVTRLWELLIGCALAAIEKEGQWLSKGHCNGLDHTSRARMSQPAVIRNAASGLGLALIIASAVFLSRAYAFPGGWALLPTLGTALVVFAGREAVLNRRVLSHRTLVGIGLISYPLYLWHWPLLYFARLNSSGPLSNGAIGGCMLAAGLLAWLTFRWVERPIRFGGRPGGARVFLLCSGMAGVLLMGILMTKGMISSRAGLTSLGKQVSQARKDWDYPFPSRFGGAHGFQLDAKIVRGKTGSAVLFIGDSHMEQYWPRINWVLHNLQGKARPVLLLTYGGIPALPHVNRVDGSTPAGFFDFAMQEALKSNVTTVVCTCFWEAYFMGGFPGEEPANIYRVSDPQHTPVRPGSPAAQAVFTDLGQAIAQLVGRGKEVVVILSSPAAWAFSPRATSRLWQQRTARSQMRVERRTLEAFVYPVKKKLIEVVVANGGKVIDPYDYFEENGFFNGITADGEFRYRDHDHLRPFYVKEKASFLDALLEAR